MEALANIPLDKLSPHTPQPWRTQVLVLEKSFPRAPLVGTTRYQRLLLGDSKGTRMQATIFGRDIDMLMDTLTVLNYYIISNALVPDIEPKHRVVPCPYQMLLNTRAIIEDAPQVEPNIVPKIYAFVPFPKLETYIFKSTLIDVIGAVVKVFPQKKRLVKNEWQPIQEFLLVNNELHPIVLTMWNQFVDNEALAITNLAETRPILAAFRVKAVPYTGLSLATRSSSSFLLNPNIVEAAHLTSSLQIQSAAVDKLVAAYILAPDTPPNTLVKKELVTIHGLKEQPDNVTFIVYCRIKTINFKKPLWYMGCNNCYKSINAAYMQTFTCHHCPAENTHAIPRARIEVDIEDESGDIQGTFFGTDAETVMGCTATSLMEASKTESYDVTSLVTINTTAQQTVQVRGSTFNAITGPMRRFNLSFPVTTFEGTNANKLSSASTSTVKSIAPPTEHTTEFILWKGHAGPNNNQSPEHHTNSLACFSPSTSKGT